jgi:hypothetical protein
VRGLATIVPISAISGWYGYMRFNGVLRAEDYPALHRWFDYWLHGLRNGITREPRVTLETAPGVWTRERDWPAPGTRPRVVALGAGDGATGTLGGCPSTGRLSYTDEALEEADLIADPSTPRDGRLAFLSGALTGPLRISGSDPEYTVANDRDATVAVDVSRSALVLPVAGRLPLPHVATAPSVSTVDPGPSTRRAPGDTRRIPALGWGGRTHGNGGRPPRWPPAVSGARFLALAQVTVQAGGITRTPPFDSARAGTICMAVLLPSDWSLSIHRAHGGGMTARVRPMPLNI